MRYRRQHSKEREEGFTIVEIAIVSVILGLMFSAGLLIITNMLSQKFETVTFKRMEVVADAISIYAQRHMRIPCPADNADVVNTAGFGLEVNFTVAAGIGECLTTATDREGIVPYATLGIPQDYARDAWGNFFTYRVSPVATVDPTTANLGTRQIGLWCLTEPVWEDSAVPVHRNIPKAHFCCGARTPAGPNGVSWDQDVVLMGPHGELPVPSRQSGPPALPGGDNNDYKNQNAPPPTRAELTDRFTPIYPAYVLVSHGANRAGAFLGGGNTIPGPFLSAAEAENADRDIQFSVTDNLSPGLPSASGGTDLFVDTIDDVVFWQSQAQVMSRVGETSCARPWNQ
ncbi:MAG: hypothetical protein DHS20C02_17610 [Micavibrio sp.]|nr:MAG: hypothetical protein DHS20C02_17610 [Micavibrio sp.]